MDHYEDFDFSKLPDPATWAEHRESRRNPFTRKVVGLALLAGGFYLGGMLLLQMRDSPGGQAAVQKGGKLAANSGTRASWERNTGK